MIQGIRKRFIRIAVAVLALAMILLAVVINVTQWVNVRSELRETLGFLSENALRQGPFPNRGGRNRHQQNNLEESQFFSVMLAENGRLILNSSLRSGDTREELLEIAREAAAQGKESGLSGEYMYLAGAERDGRRMITFLNCETKLTGMRNLVIISAAACAGGILLSWLIVSLVSSRVIRPMVQNAIQQKQFITDAGHELKTPLTVISANMDVLSLKDRGNEWIESTREQVANMRRLVTGLIDLSRMDEDGATLQKEELDFSALVREAAGPFTGMAEFHGKTLELSVQDGVALNGNADSLKKLVSQLCDNAVRYAPEGDAIALALTAGHREAVLTCENGLETPMDPETVSHLFDRFYRPDASRTRDSGGYGIGLSMVRAVAEKHGGKVTARLTEGERLSFCCSLPLR